MRKNKLLGQNFLKNKGIVERIIKEANLKKQDVVLEVGPGEGVLTTELAKRVKKVVAIEKDQRFVDLLRSFNIKNLEVIKGDALKEKINFKNYKLIANIPYYITSPLIRKFLEGRSIPNEMILMVQKEVAKRICAKPPKMSLLAVSVQYYAKPEILFIVSRENFDPVPKVDSAVIRITPLFKQRNDSFFKLVKAGFSNPRKQILNNLSKGLDKSKEETASLLLENDIKPEKRAESLSIEDWEKLLPCL